MQEIGGKLVINIYPELDIFYLINLQATQSNKGGRGLAWDPGPLAFSAFGTSGTCSYYSTPSMFATLGAFGHQGFAPPPDPKKMVVNKLNEYLL